MGLYRMFAAAAPPNHVISDGGGGITMGVEFYVTETCWVTSLAWWWTRSGSIPNLATRTLALYRCDGGNAGTKVSADVTSTPSGSTNRWYIVDLPTPVQLVANTRYRVACHHPDNGYTSTLNQWTSTLTNGPLKMPSAATATNGKQGSYVYGSSVAFPYNQWSTANYWVDVVVSDVDPGGQVAYDGTATLAGAGALTAATVKRNTDSRATSGSGDLSAAGRPGFTRPVALSGDGGVAGITDVYQVAVAVGGTAALSARGFNPTDPVRPPVFRVRDGVLVPTRFQFANERPPGGLYGEGALTAAGVPGWSGAAALSGVGGLASTFNVFRSVAVSGSGALALTSRLWAPAAAAASGSGELVASGRVPAASPAALTGSGTVTGSGRPNPTAAAALSGSGALGAFGVPGTRLPTVASSSTAVSVRAATIAVNTPAGTQAGDTLVAIQYLDSDGSTAALTGATGWTPVGAAVGTGASSSGSGFARVFTKVATGSEPSSHTFAAHTAADCRITVLRVVDADPAAPFLVAPTWTVGTTNPGTSHAAPSVTGADGALLINAWYFMPGANVTWTLPTGTTGASPLATTGWVSGVVGHKALTSGAVTGTQTATSTVGGQAGGGVRLSMALRGSTTTQTVLFADDFTGTNGGALNSSKWGLGMTGTGASVTIQGNRARFVTGSAGGYSGNARVSRRVLGVTNADVEISGIYVPQGEVYPEIYVRAADTLFDSNSGYTLRLPAPGGSNSVHISRLVNWTRTNVASMSNPVTAGVEYGLRFRVVGAALYGKFWVASAGEPASWQLTATDSTIAGSGNIGIGLGPGNIGGAYAEFDNFMITTP